MVTTVLNVNSAATLDAAIAAIDAEGARAATNTAYTINVTMSFNIDAAMPVINLPGGSTPRAILAYAPFARPEARSSFRI